MGARGECGSAPGHVLIAGVRKAGTTSLYTLLSQHPQVCPSRVKEPCFFSPLRWHTHLPVPVERYDTHFPSAVAPWRLEASTDTAYAGSRAIAAIQRHVQEPRVVIVLRDPTQRLHSYYQFARSRLAIGEDFTFQNFFAHSCRLRDRGEDVRQTNEHFFELSAGHYVEYVPDWLDAFEDHSRIAFAEHLAEAAVDVARDLCAWLGLDPDALAGADTTPQNRTVTYRNAGLQRAAVRANQRGEVLLRRLPRAKAALRRAYYRVNGSLPDTQIQPALRARIEDHYAASNAALRDDLVRRGYTRLPVWLDTAAERR